MTFDLNVANLIPTILSILLGAVVYRINRGQDMRESRINSLENKVQSLELVMARDMPSKEDVEKVWERLDRLDNTLSQVRDMVLRLDERGKIHAGE